MEVTIPANTTATVHVPAKDAAAVTEGGNTIDKAKGVKFLRMENNAAVYAVGSGTYRFQSTLTETTQMKDTNWEKCTHEPTRILHLAASLLAPLGFRSCHARPRWRTCAANTARTRWASMW